MHCHACRGDLPDGADSCPACGTAVRPPSRTVAGKPTDHAGPDDLLTRVRRDLAGDYEVHAELGRGGMAVVYKATELELLRPVALKVLPPELSASQAMAERFKREARLAASFDHPNIIPIYRVGQAGGLFYIAMKFIEGRSLDDLVEQQGALPIPVVLHVLRATTRALAFAHQHGIIHRDIKGANILIDQDGRVVVSDFGIARAGEDAGLTATGMLMGTPYFMSPEQCAGHRVGHQSDQYSLGVVAFQLLTGMLPFRAETIPGVMQHHFFTPVPDIRGVRADIPEPLVALVQRALAKRADDRFASTRDMLDAVEAIPFDEAQRRAGESLLRDLVLGVPVPRVKAAALPPLQETLLMTSPPTPAPTPAPRTRATRRRVGAAGGLVAVGAAGYLAATLLSAAPRVGATTRTMEPEVAAGPPPVAAAPDVGAPVAAARDSGHAEPPRAVAAAVEAPPTSPEIALPPRDAPKPERRAAGKLRVRVQPSDAEIRVDGRVIGRGIVLDSLLTAGTHRLRATAPGYVAVDTLIVVTAGETSQVGTIRLVPVNERP